MTKAEIVEAVQEALGNHPCRYTAITPDEARQIVDMLLEVGDGDLRNGIAQVRKNHEWTAARSSDELDAEYTANHELVSAIRRGMGSIGTHVAKGIAWALITGLAFLVWLGFKAKLFQ